MFQVLLENYARVSSNSLSFLSASPRQSQSSNHQGSLKLFKVLEK